VTANNCSCTSSGCTACSAGSSWNPSSSSTFSQRGKALSIQYGSGIVTGRTGMDGVSLGGFTIADQVIGIVDKAARVLPGNVEGIMGLAFGTIARAGGTPWWLRVVQGDASNSGGTVDSPLMSFWLSRCVFFSLYPLYYGRNPHLVVDTSIRLRKTRIIQVVNSSLAEPTLRFIRAISPILTWCNLRNGGLSRWPVWVSRAVEIPLVWMMGERSLHYLFHF
jgi:Eukaryotic aspartyl protease